MCFSVSVSLLRGLPEEKLAKVVDCLEVVSISHSTTFLPDIFMHFIQFHTVSVSNYLVSDCISVDQRMTDSFFSGLF